jgi:hypothetical protein
MIVVLGAVAMAPATALAAAPQQTLSVTLTRNSLGVEIVTKTADGSVPPPATLVTIRLGKGLVLDTTDPRHCKNTAACDSSTQVGSGSATGQSQLAPPPSPPLTAMETVTDYSGPLKSGFPSLVLALSGPAPGSLVGTVQPDTGPYAGKLVVPVDRINVPGTMNQVSLTDFKTTVGGSNANASGSKTVSSKKTFSIPKGKTKTVQLIYPHALEFGGAKYSCGVKATKGLKVLSKGSALGGSVCQAKVKNSGKKAGKATLTATTNYPWQFVSFKGCTGSVPFEVDTTNNDGSMTTATATAPCPA